MNEELMGVCTDPFFHGTIAFNTCRLSVHKNELIGGTDG